MPRGAMVLTAIYGSPRENGNTDLLLKAFVQGARGQGAEVREIRLRDLSFSPCTECGGCSETGCCVLHDDMGMLYPLLEDSDILVLSAPVFFYNLNALSKAMVDRCQCFWVRKYMLDRPLRAAAEKRGTGVFLCAGGSKGKRNFDCTLLTVRYFFDALGMDFARHLAYRDINDKGAIERHPDALAEARDLGKQLARDPASGQ